jgi:hypothetical protein
MKRISLFGFVLLLRGWKRVDHRSDYSGRDHGGRGDRGCHGYRMVTAAATRTAFGCITH